MAAAIVVSVSMGVMKPVLEKLTTLMGDKYKKIKGLRKKVSFLEHELSYMNSLLEKMEDADKLDPQAKIWRKDIIEMSYDIEDYIDDFIHCFGEVEDKVGMGILQKASHYLGTFKDRHRLANQVQEIENRVMEASECRNRYMLDQCISITTLVIVDPRLSALYKESASLVGIDTQKEELVKWVMDEGQQLKVVSIVGFGGLGKTTLANEVYGEVSGKFDCKALVSISQKPDMIRILNSVQNQLGIHTYSDACSEKDLIDGLRGHLQHKRYFIVVDDLWDIQAWNTIGCVFPKNNLRSRVMITTRDEDVARACYDNQGCIHNMRRLVGCRVHDMMLDLIRSKCEEYNFVSVVHGLQAMGKVQDNVRRLSVDLSGAEDATMPEPTTSHLSKVRSLAISGGSKWKPPLVEFKFLRVLFLELSFPKQETGMDLTAISQLSHVKYLNINVFPCSVMLPAKISGLRQLQTLEINCNSVSNIPSDIVDLPCLSHLALTSHENLCLPDGIGKMKWLRTLWFFSLPKSSPENIKGISELTNLAELYLDCDREESGCVPTATWMAALSSSLEKLSSWIRPEEE